MKPLCNGEFGASGLNGLGSCFVFQGHQHVPGVLKFELVQPSASYGSALRLPDVYSRTTFVCKCSRVIFNKESLDSVVADPA